MRGRSLHAGQLGLVLYRAQPFHNLRERHCLGIYGPAPANLFGPGDTVLQAEPGRAVEPSGHRRSRPPGHHDLDLVPAARLGKLRRRLLGVPGVGDQ